MTPPFDPQQPLADEFRHAVTSELDGFFVEQVGALSEMRPDIDPLAVLARGFTVGGKRIRPAFCYWGYVAVAPAPVDPAPLLRAAASLDLLHVSALMHDDVMDDSALRRGQPSAHVQLASLHRDRDGVGSPEDFGRAGAILLGDMLLMWSAELFERSGFDDAELGRARRFLHLVRTEVTGGQFLDVSAQTQPIGAPEAAVAEAQRIVEYKSARYTVVRPLQIGAALAGATDEQLEALGRAGSPLGRAFQYRDDVLGVFGDESVTGKPTGDDLREGKRTALLGYALGRLADDERDELLGLVGRPDLSADEVARAQELIRSSGAIDDLEATIAADYQSALEALEAAGLREEALVALRALARAAVEREA